MVIADGATESKPAPVKKVSNAARAEQMAEADRATQVQALDTARDALGDSPRLEVRKPNLTRDTENLRKLKLDRNLGVEIERERDFH